MNQRGFTNRAGFTLIELLVVVAIGLIILALVFPAMQRSKASAERSLCLVNLRNIGGAFHGYLGENNFKIFPRGVQGGSSNYIAYLAPYASEAKTYRCPSTKTPVSFTERTYKINNTSAAGKGWLYERSYFDVIDRANTIFVFDRGDIGKRKLLVRDTVEWDRAADLSTSTDVLKNYPINHSRNGDGLNLLFLDGNVRYEKYPFRAELYEPR